MSSHLHSFLTLLAGKNQAVVEPIIERLQLLNASPDEYFERYEEELNERGMYSAADYSTVELQQIVLIDQLERANLVAEVDWEADAEDISWNLARVASQQGYVLAEFPVIEDEELDTEQILASISRSLAAQGFTLLEMDLNSDSYPLILIPTTSVESAHEMAAELGLTLREDF